MRSWTLDDILSDLQNPNVASNFTDSGPQVPDVSAQPPIPPPRPQLPQTQSISTMPREPQSQPAPAQMDPVVKEYLLKKFDLGEHNDENRQKLVEQNTGVDLGDKISGALSAIGAGFQGRDAGAAMQSRLSQIQGQKKGIIDQFDKARDQKIQGNKIARDEEKFDPNSSTSMAFKKAIESNFPEIAKAYGENWANVSAADQDLIFEPLKLKETIDARKMMAQEQRDERRFLAGMKQQEREDLREEKRDDKLAQLAVPGYERTGEVMAKPDEAAKFRKATATSDALSQKLNRMRDLVKDKGSFEWGGDAGTEMESLATEIQLLGKSPELYELGVLTGPDLSLLQKITADPSSFSSLFTRDASRLKQIDSQLKSVQDKIGTTAKSLGYRKAGGDSVAPEAPAEVERKTKDGKIAVFDAKTKQFLRYK